MVTIIIVRLIKLIKGKEFFWNQQKSFKVTLLSHTVFFIRILTKKLLNKRTTEKNNKIEINIIPDHNTTINSAI